MASLKERRPRVSKQPAATLVPGAATPQKKRRGQSLLGGEGRAFPVKFTEEQLDAIAVAARLDLRSSSSDFIRVTVLKKLREMGLWKPREQPGPDPSDDQAS